MFSPTIGAPSANQISRLLSPLSQQEQGYEPASTVCIKGESPSSAEIESKEIAVALNLLVVFSEVCGNGPYDCSQGDNGIFVAQCRTSKTTYALDLVKAFNTLLDGSPSIDWKSFCIFCEHTSLFPANNPSYTSLFDQQTLGHYRTKALECINSPSIEIQLIGFHLVNIIDYTTNQFDKRKLRDEFLIIKWLANLYTKSETKIIFSYGIRRVFCTRHLSLHFFGIKILSITAPQQLKDFLTAKSYNPLVREKNQSSIAQATFHLACQNQEGLKPWLKGLIELRHLHVSAYVKAYIELIPFILADPETLFSMICNKNANHANHVLEVIGGLLHKDIPFKGRTSAHLPAQSTLKPNSITKAEYEACKDAITHLPTAPVLVPLAVSERLYLNALYWNNPADVITWAKQINWESSQWKEAFIRHIIRIINSYSQFDAAVAYHLILVFCNLPEKVSLRCKLSDGLATLLCTSVAITTPISLPATCRFLTRSVKDRGTKALLFEKMAIANQATADYSIESPPADLHDFDPRKYRDDLSLVTQELGACSAAGYTNFCIKAPDEVERDKKLVGFYTASLQQLNEQTPQSRQNSKQQIFAGFRNLNKLPLAQVKKISIQIRELLKKYEIPFPLLVEKDIILKVSAQIGIKRYSRLLEYLKDRQLTESEIDQLLCIQNHFDAKDVSVSDRLGIVRLLGSQDNAQATLKSIDLLGIVRLLGSQDNAQATLKSIDLFKRAVSETKNPQLSQALDSLSAQRAKKTVGSERKCLVELVTCITRSPTSTDTHIKELLSLLEMETIGFVLRVDEKKQLQQKCKSLLKIYSHRASYNEGNNLSTRVCWLERHLTLVKQFPYSNLIVSEYAFLAAETNKIFLNLQAPSDAKNFFNFQNHFVNHLLQSKSTSEMNNILVELLEMHTRYNLTNSKHIFDSHFSMNLIRLINFKRLSKNQLYLVLSHYFTIPHINYSECKHSILAQAVKENYFTQNNQDIQYVHLRLLLNKDLTEQSFFNYAELQSLCLQLKHWTNELSLSAQSLAIFERTNSHIAAVIERPQISQNFSTSYQNLINNYMESYDYAEKLQDFAAQINQALFYHHNADRMITFICLETIQIPKLRHISLGILNSTISFVLGYKISATMKAKNRRNALIKSFHSFTSRLLGHPQNLGFNRTQRESLMNTWIQADATLISEAIPHYSANDYVSLLEKTYS